MEHIGCAFRWRPSWPCSQDDLVRVAREPDCALVVMANAGEDGFSTCWAPGSRLVLEQFLSAWDGSGGSLRSRLEASARYVRRNFLDQARQLYEPEDGM